MPDSISATRRRVVSQLFTLPMLAAAPRPLWSATQTPVPGPDEVLNVMDFEALARAALPPAHFGYLATGVDDDRTVAINHEAFSLVQIRSRRFVDVSHADPSVRLFGVTHPTPIYLSAVGSQRAFHPEGELATARAAATRSMLMMLSTAASTGVEEVTRARGSPVWMQLYPTDDWT
jgi:isopentenyl diphosphate isomerase/L-lactate dehydrogenase-like FMN-dependent dehydrogenase